MKPEYFPTPWDELGEKYLAEPAFILHACNAYPRLVEYIKHIYDDDISPRDLGAAAKLLKELGELERNDDPINNRQRIALRRGLMKGMIADLSLLLLGQKLPVDIIRSETGEIIWPAERKITQVFFRKIEIAFPCIELDAMPPSLICETLNRFSQILSYYSQRFSDTASKRK